MANERKVSKRVVATSVEIELCKKVEAKYARQEDKNKMVAYIRALEDATREILLTAEQWKEIVLEVEENQKKRMNNRNKKIGGRQ